MTDIAVLRGDVRLFNFIFMRIFLIILSLTGILKAQQHDNIFMFGHHTSDEPGSKGALLDFSVYPPTLSEHQQNLFNISLAGLSMSDECGNPIFFTNGLEIRDSTWQKMPNGEFLNSDSYALHTRGHLDTKGIISLPKPGNMNKYAVFNRVFNLSDSSGVAIEMFSIYKHEIDMNLNEGQGEITSKDVPIINGFYLINPSYTRHGNGRDWWLLSGENFSNHYYKVIFSEEEFTVQDTQQIGFKYPATATDFRDIESQKLFTPDGQKYIDYDARNGVRVMDFDRCTGELSNYQWIEFDDFIGNGSGAAVSPNSRFLYVTGSGLVLQYDLETDDIAASVDTIGIYNRIILQNGAPYSHCQLAPDGKIYICTGAARTETLHVINNPDEKGKRCEFMPHSVQLPNTNRYVLPRYPNYRLYDLPDSPCDTLGIDGPPEFDCGN